jgi:hypothetical protein
MLAAVVLTCALEAETQVAGRPATVIVHNGALALHALLWRPPGPRPVPRRPLQSRERPHP